LSFFLFSVYPPAWQDYSKRYERISEKESAQSFGPEKYELRSLRGQNPIRLYHSFLMSSFIADRTNGHDVVSVCPSVVCL